MNTRPRLLYKLMQQNGIDVVKTWDKGRLLLVQINKPPFHVKGNLKRLARKTSSFRKGKKYYAR